ncbi:MAG TPA: hypothetical protein VGE74_04655 [Gemmata sp.]
MFGHPEGFRVEVVWDEQRSLWCGHTVLDADGRVEVAITAGDIGPELARSYAALTLSQLAPRTADARRYAARKLAEYYNYFHAHLPDGEQVTAEEFASRLRLEGVRLRNEGDARLDFGHDLYRSGGQYAGGLVVVEADAGGKFRRAYWVTEPDAQEARRTRRCT